MSQENKFSIIMANYNRGKYIGQAIESVLKQSHNDWELVIVDDCSSDNSIEIINEYTSDSRIKLFTHQKNYGYGASCKTAVEKSSSEIIGVLDSDDFLHPKAIQKILEVHEKNPDHGYVYSSHFNFIDTLDFKVRAHWVKSPQKSLLHNYSASHFRTFKRVAYQGTLGFDPALKAAVDRDLSYKLEEKTKVFFLNKCLYYRRIHNSGISQGKQRGAAKYFDVIARHNAFLRRIGKANNLNRKEISDFLFNKFLESLKEENFSVAKKLLIRAFNLKSFHFVSFSFFIFRIIKFLPYRFSVKLKLIYLKIFKYKSIDLKNILIGQQNGMALEEWIEKTKDHARISVLLQDSPYVKLLQTYEKDKDLADDIEKLKQTEYWKMAEHSIEKFGQFFEARRVDEIPVVIKNYINIFDNYNNLNSINNLFYASHSSDNEPIELKKIKHSDCYEVIDGHHRLAVQYVKKQKQVNCYVGGEKLTYLQELIIGYKQTHGDPELYQPIDKPELQTWPVVRKCSDRYELMKSFLSDNNLEIKTLLDLSCSYGWFVKEFGKEGVATYGIDKDKNAVKIGRVIYGLKDQEIIQSEIIDFVSRAKKNNQKYDATLFLSILHHFIIGKEKGGARELLQKIDKLTAKVMFFDTGQNHEAWYRESLKEWDEDYIIKFIKHNTSFKKVIKIGYDQDNQGQYSNQYKRALFACLR